jgi:hypothetical protein
VFVCSTLEQSEESVKVVHVLRIGAGIERK